MKNHITFLISLLIIITLGAPSMHAHDGTDTLPRTINVNGKAEIKAEPDRARLTLGVEARNKELSVARAEVDKAVKNILTMLDKKLDISKKRIKSAQLITRPEYNYSSNRKRNLIGYYASRSIEVDLHDLDKLGELMHEATELGITNMNSPQFYTSKKDELYREALVEASQNAKMNAQVLADSLDTRLGEVHQINATNVYFNQPNYGARPMARSMKMEAATDMGGAETYNVGEITVTADVNVVFDID